MTLDEAIAHSEEMANETPCGQEHRQLADWLKELRELKANPFCNKSAIFDAFKAIGKELAFCEANVQKRIGLSLFGLGKHCEIIREIISKATTSSMRNCDVGSAEDQRKRFNRFCEKGQHTDKACCGGCPIVVEGHREKVGVSCELAWAMMPYEDKSE